MSRDDLGEYIAEKLEEGLEVTGEDFEGRRCSYCGQMIPFTDIMADPELPVTWETPVVDVEIGEEEPYVHRDYFCSEECKRLAMRDQDWLAGDCRHNDGDRMHVDQLEVDNQ